MSEEHDHLTVLLDRLKLTAMRDQLDSLIDEAGRGELTIREALTLFCEREIARRDQRRIDMAFGLARFPFVRDLTGFDFGAQPSLDKAQIREIATGRFIANGEAVLLLGPPGVGKTHLAVALDTGHTKVEGTNSWPIQANLLRPHLGALYVKDYTWVENKKTLVPLGQGNIDSRYPRQLLKSGYTGPVNLHVEYLKPFSKENVPKQIAAIKRDVGTLRKWLGWA